MWSACDVASSLLFPEKAWQSMADHHKFLMLHKGLE